jgi:hypothetical protein
LQRPPHGAILICCAAPCADVVLDLQSAHLKPTKGPQR